MKNYQTNQSEDSTNEAKYNDIAKHAFDALKRLGLSDTQGPITKDSSDPQSTGRPGGFEGVILGIGELVYSILLLTIFFIEVQWCDFFCLRITCVL
ncbi:protein EI24 homolog [Asparagus officinalis]|uniref:protein EI24 homolog n=1 Tax=Asparagus officinalis TaxID=4686 RepID=UPI00098E583D|nr:protein EI24 homolog [Asparagus officinalis]